jgi:hypothetical protein
MKKEISPKMNEIELRLLDALLGGDDPILDSLWVQLAEAKIESRELSGSGFLLNFTIPDSIPKSVTFPLNLRASSMVVGDHLCRKWLSFDA